MKELDETIHEHIKLFCKVGDDFAEKKMYRESISEYNKAWALIPEPKDEWDASTWVLAAIADASFLAGFYELAKTALDDALNCPGGLGNPFLHLRLGQVQYELNDLDRAADELMRAYMGDGGEVFNGQDPKYLAFLKTRADIP